jgi:hypothetical protein
LLFSTHFSACICYYGVSGSFCFAPFKDSPPYPTAYPTLSKSFAANQAPQFIDRTSSRLSMDELSQTNRSERSVYTYRSKVRQTSETLLLTPEIQSTKSFK